MSKLFNTTVLCINLFTFSVFFYSKSFYMRATRGLLVETDSIIFMHGSTNFFRGGPTFS